MAAGLEEILGPVLIGVLVSTLLTGFVLLQVYIYWKTFPKDGGVIKAVVRFIVICSYGSIELISFEGWRCCVC